MTVYGPLGGEWDDDGNYRVSNQESMCAGAIIYLEKKRETTVAMRLGRHFGLYDSERLAAHHDVTSTQLLTSGDCVRPKWWVIDFGHFPASSVGATMRPTVSSVVSRAPPSRELFRHPFGVLFFG